MRYVDSKLEALLGQRNKFCSVSVFSYILFRLVLSCRFLHFSNSQVAPLCTWKFTAFSCQYELVAKTFHQAQCTKHKCPVVIGDSESSMAFWKHSTTFTTYVGELFKSLQNTPTKYSKYQNLLLGSKEFQKVPKRQLLCVSLALSPFI